MTLSIYRLRSQDLCLYLLHEQKCICVIMERREVNNTVNLLTNTFILLNKF